MSSHPTNPDTLPPLRHSLAHLLAAAVLELWPDTKRAIGPAIENGFYYDFDFSNAGIRGTDAEKRGKITDEDLPLIEKKMRELLPSWSSFAREEVTPAKAREHFKDEPFKLELIDEFAGNGEKLSIYTSGEYSDLCAGGHVENARDINPAAFTLTKIAGAYWRGSEENPMLTRIYGLAFSTKDELEHHLKML
ncbi:MAG: threonine--tRNA ligase, partial [Parcubacteria group bacterium]|nr:threonine--tRNA ligase [Parcubacteria group bacterium]